jgi:hypothetical protein
MSVRAAMPPLQARLSRVFNNMAKGSQGAPLTVNVVADALMIACDSLHKFAADENPKELAVLATQQWVPLLRDLLQAAGWLYPCFMPSSRLALHVKQGARVAWQRCMRLSASLIGQLQAPDEAAFQLLVEPRSQPQIPGEILVENGICEMSSARASGNVSGTWLRAAHNPGPAVGSWLCMMVLMLLWQPGPASQSYVAVIEMTLLHDCCTYCNMLSPFLDCILLHGVHAGVLTWLDHLAARLTPGVMQEMAAAEVGGVVTAVMVLWGLLARDWTKRGIAPLSAVAMLQPSLLHLTRRVALLPLNARVLAGQDKDNQRTAYIQLGPIVRLYGAVLRQDWMQWKDPSGPLATSASKARSSQGCTTHSMWSDEQIAALDLYQVRWTAPPPWVVHIVGACVWTGACPSVYGQAWILLQAQPKLHQRVASQHQTTHGYSQQDMSQAAQDMRTASD